MKFRPLPVMPVVCLLAILAASPAQATIMKYMEIEELARLSSDVFHGQVVSADAYWNPEHTRIYTAVRVRIHESFKGTARRDQLITLTQFGGEKDGIRMDYSGRPEFSPGESVVLFATRTRNNDLTVVGLKQGKMNLVGEEIKRDFSGLTLVDSLTGAKALRPLAVKTSRVTLNEFRNRIARTK